MGRVGPQALAAWRPAAQGRHVGLHPRLVDEHQARGGDLRLMGLPARAPARHVRACLLLGQQSFFEAQPFGVDEHPHRLGMGLDPALGQLRRQPLQRERTGADPLSKPLGAVPRQRPGLVAADLSGGRRAGLPIPPRPLRHARGADLQRLGDLPMRLAGRLAGQRPFAKIHRIGRCHRCRPPPAATMNQIPPDLRIPIPPNRGPL